MAADDPTHDLPVTAEGFDRIARLSGEGDTGRFRAGIRERLDRVAALTEAFFAPTGAEAAEPDL